MANNCSDGLYTISFTDITVNPITVNKQTLIQDELDITLLGKSRKEYGEVFNENTLHILENFACPEDPSNPGNPDLTQVFSNLLSQPTNGQIWFNKTVNRPYIWNGATWEGLGKGADIGGNSGIIFDGGYLPRPINASTGYQYDYSECSWVVTPYNFPDEIDYMVCFTDVTGLVHIQYRTIANSTIVSGYANYQIIGIRGNINVGDNDVTPLPPPDVSPSPSPLPGMTPTPTPTVTQSLGITPSPTPTHTVGATITPTPTRTQTPAPTTSPTPTRAPTPTPTPTITPSASVAPLGATLFIGPSKGYPSGTNVEIPSPCTTGSGSLTACLSTLSVIIQGISGGVAPYSVNFAGLSFGSGLTDTTSGTSVGTTTINSYAGASGTSSSPLRTGATSAMTLQASAQISVTGSYNGCHNGQWTLSISAGSHVVISDSSGQTLTLYTPSALNGNVYGTSFKTTQGAYSDSWFSNTSCGGGGGGCVSVDSVFPDGSIAKSVKMGQLLTTADPYATFEQSSDEVTYSHPSMQPSVRIVTSSGAALVCSETAPIPTKTDGYMLAPTLLNRSVPVMRNGTVEWEVVTDVVPVGDRLVQHITVNNRCFWAGETADAFILHHNLKPTPSE